jgi:hypothetical protein
MTLEDLIPEIEAMPEPDRKADKTIAVAIGMQESDAGGEDYWQWGDRAFRRVPAFTYSVDAALLLAEAAQANCCGACTFGADLSTAVLDGGNRGSGATPAIAICVAALKLMARERRHG